MTTIPIEVIIQDAESPVTPTPTPESGEETNIIVPDTGAGTINNTSNSGGIGSSASIILPAIIAVLAIGAIVAMLIHKHQKHQNDKLSKKEKLATAVSSTIAILAATVLVGNLVIPATKAATDETNGSADTNEGTYLETEDKVTIVATIDKDSKEPTIVTVKDILYATTDASGYTVTMSMIEDALTSNLYLNGDETSQYYIAPVELDEVNGTNGADEASEIDEDATEGVELATNTWGYRLSEESGYLPVPVANAPATVAEGEAVATHEEINVYYGLKVDGTLPLGTYSGEIEYNITPVNPIDKLTYMQDFAKLSAEDKAKLLTSMPEGEQYILKDKRDEKPYYISKLADGNVWMTQNLDFDIVAGETYTSADTDIATDWTPSASTHPADDHSWDFSGLTIPNSYDSGDLYWNGELRSDQDGTLENMTNDFGNTHYHIGNYYNWTAAVAMDDSSAYTTDQDVGQSICPAGWGLPLHSGDRSFQNLVSAQKLVSGVEGNMQSNPVYFVYGGSRSKSSSNVGYVGYVGVYWSSSVHDGYAAYYLSFDYDGNIDTSANMGWRATGYQVRCVAK